MKKHIPDIITLIRIPLSLSLFLAVNDEWLFVTIYLACGLSDVLDGFIARKMNVQSESGAKLDSLADLFMFGTILGVLMIWDWQGVMRFVPALVVIALIRITNLFIVFYKFNRFAVIHTLGNKLTGILIFTVPLFYIVTHSLDIARVTLFFALSASLEESCIILKMKVLDTNRKGLFFR